jgi:hypothetical protein
MQLKTIRIVEWNSVSVSPTSVMHDSRLQISVFVRASKVVANSRRKFTMNSDIYNNKY